MSRKALFFHPEAQLEMEAAFQWYAERSARAAEAFLAEIDRALTRVEEAPGRWPSYLWNTHRYPLRRFPFLLIYRETTNQIQIMAVAHGRRKPGYWKNRADRP